MEAALNVIREQYTKGDAVERQKIQEQIRDLQNDLYTDWEVVFGNAYGVSHIPALLSRKELTP
jgi:demethylsterigmatocystin 6-O-methyltransferase